MLSFSASARSAGSCSAAMTSMSFWLLETFPALAKLG
jgi:hypothetical protein